MLDGKEIGFKSFVEAINTLPPVLPTNRNSGNGGSFWMMSPSIPALWRMLLNILPYFSCC